MKNKLQILIAMMLCTLWVARSYAQTVYIEDYTCSSSVETYTPVGSTATVLSPSSDDDGYATLTLPFAFTFGSTTMASGSSIYMSVNGFITLNTGYSSTTPSYSGSYDVISPLGHDLHLRTNGQLKSEVSGTAPDRVLTLEWSNVESYSAGNIYNFQVKLYEGSNDIKFCYGNSTVTSSRSAYCFLREYTQDDYVIALNNWNTPVFVTSGSTFSKNLDASQYPSNGRTYTFARPTPTCSKPTSLATSNITASSATVTWTAGGNETSWEVICAELSDDISTLTPTVVTTPSYTAQNLINDHQYVFYVRAQCPNGVETSAWKSMIFRTDCGAGIQSLPYTEDFSSYGGTGSYTYFPSCWSRVSTAGSYPYISSTGGNSLYLYTTGGNYTVATTPALDLAISPSTVAVRFKMYAGSQTYVLKVGVMSDSSDINTFVPVATITPASTGTWDEYDVYFNSYTGTGQYIAFLSDARTLSSANVVYIDDVSITPLPTCARPASLHSTAATDNSVTLEWSTAGTESQWNVKYYETGDTTTMVIATANAHPFTVNGLIANTSYTFFVQANCGTETSEWSTPYTTPTLYVAPAVLPYVCDFESSTEVNNWGFENDTCANQWVIGNAVNNTLNGNSALYISNDNGTSNSYTFTAPATVYAVRDIMMDNSYDYYTVTYDYKVMGQGTTDYLRLYLGMTGISMVQGNAAGSVNTIPGAAVLNIDNSSYQSSQVDWRHVNLLLDKETWGNRVVRLYFMWHNDASAGENPPAAIDNLEVKGYSCPMVADVTVDANTLTTNSATINWTDTLNTGNYEVVIVPMGGNPDGYTPSSVTSTSYTFTGLTHSTQYTAYVRMSCGTDMSAWRGITFSTVCGPISTLPYTQNFDGLTTGSSAPLPNCWTRNTNSSTQYPYLSTSYHSTGNASLYFYGTTTYYSYAVLPEVDTVALPLNTLMLNLKSLKTSTTSTYGRFDVGVMTDPTNVNTFTVVKSFYGTDMPTTGTWYNQEVMFNNFTGNGSYIAIRTPNVGTSYVYIDDVELTTIPTCLPPTDVTMTGITSDAVTVSWTPRNGEYNWNVVVVPHGDAVTSGTPELTSTYPYTVSNLLPNTQYDVYVQADCGNGDESSWSVVSTFTTKCVPATTIPYTESFDGQGSGTAAFPNCWTRISTYNAQYPYINTTIHSDGNAALYFYQPSGTYTTLAATQALDLSTYNPGDLALSFHLSAYSGLSYARMDVGVMTDPTDMGTFTTLRSFYPSDFTATNQWREIYIPLTQQFTTPVYFAFYLPQSSTTTYMYLDQVKVDYAPDCSAPTNLTFTNVAGTSALVSWTPSQFGDGDYTLEYSDDNVNWTTISTTDNFALISGLLPTTTYYVQVYRNCTVGNSTPVSGSFTTGCLAGGERQIGTGTTTSYLFPLNNFYNYTYTQQIYLSSEMSGACDITGIMFDYAYSSAMTSKTNVKIYLGHTTQSTFSSTSNYVPLSNLQLVYSGTLNCHNGWNTFQFDSIFHYNGTSNLVLAVDDNSGSYNGTSYVFNVHSTGSNYRSLYYYSDSDNPDPSNPTSGSPSSSYSSGNRNNVKFISPCDLTVTCIAPNLVVSDVTSQDITVDWVPGSTETQWELEYKVGNGNWTSVGTVTTPPYILTNVTNDVDYSFRMRSDCGNNEYSSYSFADVHVPCTYVATLPLTENFDANTSSGSGHMVPCWTRNSNYTSTLYPYTSSSYHHSGSYSVYFYATSAYYSYIASPRFDDNIQMDSLLVTFWAYKSSANYFIEVGVMSDPYDISTFVPVGTFSPQQLNTFEFSGVSTRGYTGNGHYIAFRCPQWIANNIYLDDVTIDYIPECYFVRNPHVVESSITPTSARVAWAPGSNETDWEVVIGVAGSITDPSTQTIDMVQNTPSLEFTNLIPNTLYEVYVRANCGGSYSIWMKCMFRTGCAAITTLPYTEDFEGYPSNTSTTPTANNLPNCWDYRNTSPSTSSGYRFYPILYTSSTYAHNSQNSMRFYVYTTTSTYGSEIGILPEIDTTVLPINTLRLTFWQRAYSTSSSSYHFPLEVGVMSDPTNAASFVPVDTFSMEGTGSTTYVQRTLDFTNYTGGGNRIAFRVAGPTASGYNYGYVDDIMIDYAPQCLPPTHLSVSSLTSTEATISWQPGDQEYEWTLIVYPAGTSPAAGVTVTVNTDTFYTVSNLTPNTYYQVLLKSNCPSGTGYSSTVETTFATMCNLISNLPFTENFDGEAGSTTTSVTNNNLPDCWFYHNTGTSTSYSGYPIIYNSAANAESGTNSMRFYVPTTTGTYSTQWAMLPGIDVTQNPMNTLMLSFDARSTSTSTPLVLEVGVMSNPLDVSTFTLIEALTISGTAYSHQEVFFPNYTGTGNVIAIRAPQGGSSNYGNVDNIVVDIAPDCSPVNSLAISQITSTSAVVSWSQGSMGTPVGFEVEYSEHNQNNWTTLTTQDNFYILSGLDLGTTYDVRVRTDCGTGYSTWVTDQFVTLSCLSSNDLQIGTGTITTEELPINNYWEYSYTQQIFLASELNGPMSIDNISFQYAYTSPSTVKNNVNIYLGHTTQSRFTSTSDYIPATGLTLVYSGNLNCTQGWNSFTFTTPFQYNGTDNLVLAIDDNSGDYDGYEYTFYAHNADSTRAIHFYQDGNDISMSSPSADNEDYTSTRSNVKFGQCDNNATCIAPNVYVANITAHTADVYWAPGYYESAWNIEYKAQNASTWTTVTATSSPVQLTGLNANTHYTVRMQSDCGSDTSDWTMREFTTDCAAITIPYSQNFDNDGTGTNAHPSCWTTSNNYSSTAYPYINTSYHTSGTAALYFYCSTSTYNLAVAPPIDLSNTQMNNLQVTFQMRSTSAITSGIVIGVMTNPSDLTTFVPVDTVHNSVTSTFELMEIPLNNYSGAGEYVALKLINSTGTYSVYIDDFTIENIPTCVRPTNLTATSTQTDITLGWNDANTGYEWIIEYGPGNFTQGTGTTVVANSNPYTITGLTPSTVYTFYVRGICSATDSSNWSLPFHANTACAPIATLPYTENFDAYSGATTTSVSINNLPVCWNHLNSGTNTSYSGYPIIYNSASSAASGVNSMRFYTYITSGSYDDQIAILPQLDLTVLQMNTLEVSFDARDNTTSYPFNIVVGIMTNPANKSTFVPIDTITTQSTTYHNYEVLFNNYSGTGSYIAIMAPRPTTGYNYGYIDNVRVDVIPSCPKPTNLTISNHTNTSVTLTWNENGSATNWEVEYGNGGFTHGTGTTVQVQGTPTTTISNLSSSTNYDFYVRAVCSSTDQSNWDGPVNITPGAYVMSATGSASVTTCDLAIYDNGGPNGDYSSNCNSTLTINPATPGAVIVLTGTSTTESGYDYLRVYDGTSTSGTMLAEYNGSNQTVNCTSTTGSLTLNFYSDGSVVYSGFALTATCSGGSSVTPPTVTTNDATNIASTSAVLNGAITPGDETITAQGFEWKTTAGGTYTAVNAAGTTPSYNLTGLTPNTNYTFRAFATTASGTTYGVAKTFTTTQSSVTPPTVTTNDATNIAQTGATLNGSVTAGSETISAQGFEWKATVGGSYAAVNATGTTISYNLTGLTTNTSYTFRAFATTASGTTYGAEKTFTTLQGQTTCPTPTNVTASNITETTADISWTQPGNTATSWDLLYKESAASSWYTATTSNNPYTLVGLTPASSYDVQIIAHCSNNMTSDPSTTITFMTVGINDYTLDNTVTLYPNPTTGLIQIENGEWRMENVEVYDAYGKLLFTVEVNGNTANLDLSGYARGTYFVRVTTEKGVVTKRVIRL